MILGAVLTATAATPDEKINPQLPTLWAVGDSTVKVGSSQRGWGDELLPFSHTGQLGRRS
jgi:hypothetical protein